METILSKSRPTKWLEIFDNLMSHGKYSSPRGQKIIELEDYHIDLDPIYDRFCNFDERKFSLRYLAIEFAWYLQADPNDTMIEAVAPFWGNIRNLDRPRWNSNYGVAMFDEEQMENALQTLVLDKDSRQACVVINRPDVVKSLSKDKICTNAVMFRIRDNKLNMTVQMRSNDVIFGLCYDLPLFSFMMEMLLVKLRTKYPDLQMGTYHHTSGSFHIYERHFQMVRDILANQGRNFKPVTFPEIKNYEETRLLRHAYPLWAKRAMMSKIDYHEKIAPSYPYPFIRNLLETILAT